ncbi:MAG: phenylalanine--tRNA ligase subunit beta [Longimicrobiales bacterium]|nr:phenylalanine--tRNA ligase subunit beta [Longimicrobiales bacterium]
MKVSRRWIEELLGESRTAEEIAERLARVGFPVEGVEDLAEGLTGIVVARVDEVCAHPNADRLRLCTVDAGTGATLQVVCGASNVKAGGCYPFVPVGGALPDGTRIRRAKLRGEVSEGMLCSARELGLGHDHAGILELPGEWTPGASFIEATGLDDERLDVEVTANRGDLLGHLGVARELGVAALPPIPGAPPLEISLVNDPQRVESGGVRLVHEAPERCGRFLAAIVRGVRVGPSPIWLQMRLRAIGTRPINNVVDATNWVLFELGQPTHAYDLSKIRGSEVRVRVAREGEGVRTLDGKEHELDPSMLVIADAERTVDIAGIMGEEESSVSEETTEILVECAHFDPRSIRATRKALGIVSDAGYRFERYVDADGQEEAIRRTLEIILAVAGGELHPEILDLHPHPFTPPVIDLSLDRVERTLGVPFTAKTIDELLTPIGFTCVEIDGGLRVEVPGWRAADVTRPVDLIEEIARRWGYDRFPDVAAGYRPGTVPDHPLFLLEDRLRDLMIGFGFFEAQTPAFVPEGEGEVRLTHPLSREEPVLRREVLPSLGRRLAYNLARGIRDVALFELATSFRLATEAGETGVAEEARLALVATGVERRHWSEEARAIDIFDLKGWAEPLLREAHGTGATLRPATDHDARWRAGWCLDLLDAEGERVGRAGALAPDTLDLPPWAGEVFGLEMGLPALPRVADERTMRPLPAHPGSERDLALLVPDEISAATIEAVAWAAGGPLLVGVEVFDHYEGAGVPTGMTATGWRFRYQADDRTLTEEEVDAATERIAASLEEECGARIRGRDE